jgi:uncharacterized protein (DUF433 family)
MSYPAGWSTGADTAFSLVACRATLHRMNHPLSVRLNDATIARLTRFVEGPADRRARLAGTGKDVWEVIVTVRDNSGDAAETADYLEMPLGLVQAAITYYGAYRDEIDQWIEANEQETAEAHAGWAAGQAAVQP